jgi:hypothetical protein
MRIACIAGFFNPVKKSIDKHFEQELANRSVIWVPQNSPGGQLSINRLKGDLFDAVGRGATHILVVAFILRGAEFLRDIIDGLVQEAQHRSPNIQITIDTHFKNAQDSDGVLKLVRAFGPTAQTVVYPSTILDLPTWIAANHCEGLTLHPRAENNLNKSQFQDIKLIYQAIQVLGTEYHAMRTASTADAAKKKAACMNRFQALGLELSPSITQTRAGEEGDDYEVTYPLGTDRKRNLDLHLKKGSDREQRYCLRIYFFWDEDSKKVVIGWLPNHLGTRAS